MGANQLHVPAQVFRRLAVQCNHCSSHATFDAEDEYGPPSEARCPNCNALMAGVPQLVKAFRDFYRELKRQQRPGYFVVNVKQPG